MKYLGLMNSSSELEILNFFKALGTSAVHVDICVSCSYLLNSKAKSSVDIEGSESD